MAQSTPHSPTGVLVRRDVHDVTITGVLKSVPCRAWMADATVRAGGSIHFEYNGGSDVFWDEQKRVQQDGRHVFLDEQGLETPESGVVLKLEDGAIIDPAQPGMASAPSPDRA